MSENLAGRVVELLKSRGETLAFCESLTAGLASATIAEIPGASVVLKGGLVTYATELKVALAGVPQELIDAHGVVSRSAPVRWQRGPHTDARQIGRFRSRALLAPANKMVIRWGKCGSEWLVLRILGRREQLTRIVRLKVNNR